MFTISDQTHVAQFADDTLPEQVLDAHAATVRVVTDGRALSPRRGDLLAALTESLFAGRDPAVDPAVLRVLHAEQLGAISGEKELSAVAYDRFRSVCLDRRDEIIGTWQKAFALAAVDLAGARRVIGDIPLEDTSSIMQLAGDTAQVWATAQSAVGTLERLRNAWHAFVTFTRTIQPSRNHHVLQVAAVPGQQWRQLSLHDSKAKPWDLLGHGIELSLPTIAQYRERVATVERAMAYVEPVADPEREAIRETVQKVEAVRAKAVRVQ